MPTHEEDDESQHFTPDAWKVAWEATQDVPAPSCQVKAAADRLVWYELLQQATGWLLLTQIGILLGSFGPVMSVGVCLLSMAVFVLEAILKFARSWAHMWFFMDVPCAYVPIHQVAAHNSLSIFEGFLMTAAALELFLYGPYAFVVIRWVIDSIYCGGDCQQGELLLVYLLLICLVTTICHGVTSLITLRTFHSAMGVPIRAWIRGKMGKLTQSSHGSLSVYSCRCNKRGCRGGRLLGSLGSQSDYDRVLCLTWWVHMARHRHLSAVVASAQPGNCGLPGHWFETVAKLKKIVEACAMTGTGEHELNSDGPLWVTQDMGLRALVSLAKQDCDPVQSCREILQNGGFELLVKVVREGKFSTSRGLAAAAIGVLATQHEALKKEDVRLAVAVIPLKRLARSKGYELKEVALGALLNTALIDDEKQFTEILSQFHAPDGIVGESRGSFMTILMELAYSGLTTRCQELAIGLLARFAGDSTLVRDALMDYDRTKQSGIQLLIQLLQHGLTIQIRASTAGVLSELAFREGRTIGRGPYGESCIQALIQALHGEPRIAYTSARALCNLAIKFAENKLRIVAAGGIERFVELLKEETSLPDDQSRMQEQVQAEAARALWILSSYNNSVNQELIAKADAIPPLMNLLWNPRPKVHLQAVAALSSLAWKHKTNQDFIGQEGSCVFQRIVQLLIDINDENMEDKVLEKVALAIFSFADGNKSNQDKLLKAGALVQLQKTVAQKDRMHKDKAMFRVRQAIECLEIDKPAENNHGQDKVFVKIQ